MDNSFPQYVRECDNCKITHEFFQSPLCFICIDKEKTKKMLVFSCDPDKCEIHGHNLDRRCAECHEAYKYIVNNRAIGNNGGFTFFNEENLWSN